MVIFLFFFLLPFRFTLLLLWWCSALFPFGVEPPPCGLAWGFLPFFCGTMPSDLLCTIVLDVSKFPAGASRVDISSAIVNRFTAYKVNAVQFVGNLARVTFSSASDRDAVMRFESVRGGDVDCVVRGGGPHPQKVFVYGYPVEGNSNLLTDALSRYGEVHDVRFRHWFHMSEVADGVRVVSMVGNQAIPRNLEVDGYHCKVSYYGQDKECDICEKTGHIAKDCPFRGKCLRCGQAGHCRNEPLAATTRGPRELPVDPEDNRTREDMESDSLVNRTVPPVEFVPESIVSSDGLIPIHRRAKRKRARIFESSDIANVDNCLVNDNNDDTASSENRVTVDIIINDVSCNSSVVNHSTASMNDNSTNNNNSCDNSHTSNVNSSRDDNNVSSNSGSSDAINNCSDNNINDIYNVTSYAASCNGVNNDISSSNIISNCVVSDKTTDITDNGNDNGNSNSSNVNICKNDKNIVIDNASSSHGNNSSTISNIACSTILVDNVPSNAYDKIDEVNDSDNNGSITWDDVVAIEDVLGNWKRSRPPRPLQ